MLNRDYVNYSPVKPVIEELSSAERFAWRVVGLVVVVLVAVVLGAF